MTVPLKPVIQRWEQFINNVIMVKQYVKSILPLAEALAGVRSELLLRIQEVMRFVGEAGNADIKASSVRPRSAIRC